jgi:hypothetical protein
MAQTSRRDDITVHTRVRAVTRRVAHLPTVVVLAVLCLIPLLVSAYAFGTGGTTGYSESGCTPCHGTAPDGGTSVIFTGLPIEVEPSTTYALNVTVTSTTVPGTTGGFNMKVTVGALTTSDSNALIASGEATHATPLGRSWMVNWTSPSGIQPVTFYVAGLASDRVGATGDAYAVSTYATVMVPEFPGATRFLVLVIAGVVVVAARTYGGRRVAVV